MAKENSPKDQSPLSELDNFQSEQQSHIPGIVKKLLNSWKAKECYEHIRPVSIPSRDKIINLTNQARRIIFPGYFSKTKLRASNIAYCIGQETVDLYDTLSEQIAKAIRHDNRRNGLPCDDCEKKSAAIALAFIEKIPEIASLLATDVRATLDGDPATDNPDEIIFSYPGLLATSIFRLAHELYLLKVPIIPRIMTEHAHSLTGIDIHPGATLGPGLCIDHGTGIVIGETTCIGKNVRLYQGVTLGALSLPRGAGKKLRHKKRHPTIEDDVIIYANTTILGGDTVIGARSIIGGNIWLTESVAPDTKVLLKRPELIYSESIYSES